MIAFLIGFAVIMLSIGAAAGGAAVWIALRDDDPVAEFTECRRALARSVR